MRDQAEKLRQIIRYSNKSDYISSTPKDLKSTKVYAITSGKGGVGKTNFTVNLAVELRKKGYEVIILDADIGFANIDVISGVMPKYTIADVLSGNKEIQEILEEGPEGIKIISGGSGIREIMQINKEKLDLLTFQLSKLEDLADYILIDTGAGLSDTVLSFVNSAEHTILVITPEPTSLTDGYAMIKALSMNNKDIHIHIVVNRAENSKESTDVFQKINRVTERFLDIKLYHLGYLADTKLVSNAVKRQRPFVLEYPNAHVSQGMSNITNMLLGSKEQPSTSFGIKGFIGRFERFLGKRG